MKQSLTQVLSTYFKEELVEFIENNQNRFDELVALSLQNNPPHSSRAAWLLSKCVSERDKRIKKYIPKFVEMLDIVSDGQQRGLINVLVKTNNYDKFSGVFFNSCVQIWSNAKKIPSTRICALKLLIQVAEKHPELCQEIKLLTQKNDLNSLSPGIAKSVGRIVSDLEKRRVF